MSELQDRLDKLATRGTPRGVDAVFADARRAASLGVIVGGAESNHDEPIPFVTEEPTARRRARRPFGSMIAAAGVAAMLLVGVLAVSAVVGSGGAGSPSAAVQRLADAVRHGDPLAAADVLAPSEVATLHDTLSEAERRAHELALVQDASAPLAGVDFSVSDLSLSTEELGDGVAKVTVNEGTLAASTKKANFSPVMQQVLRDSHDNSRSVDLAKIAASENVPTFVVAVRENGRWYVSAAYTVLEYVREINHASAPPQFGAGNAAIASLGAATPDEAAQKAVRALAANDWDSLFSLVRPSEIPIYDYRAVLEDLIQRNDVRTRFTVNAVSSTSTVSGSTAHVVVHAKGTSDAGSWSLDGGCFRGPDRSNAAGDVVAGSSFCVGNGDAPYGLYGPSLGLLLGGSSQGNSTQAVTVVEDHGRWFVSPVGTVLQVVDDAIAHITKRDLYVMLGIPYRLPADGSLTLGAPVTLPVRSDAKIVSFEGHKGEQLLAQANESGAAKNTDVPPVSFNVYGPDGHRLDAYEMAYGQPFELPSDGTYTFVLRSFAQSPSEFTLWDAVNAPDSVKHPPSAPPASECVLTGVNNATCSGQPVPVGSSSSETFFGSSSSKSSAVTIPAPAKAPVTAGAGG